MCNRNPVSPFTVPSLSLAFHGVRNQLQLLYKIWFVLSYLALSTAPSIEPHEDYRHIRCIYE
jgi:hypothetical protein